MAVNVSLDESVSGVVVLSSVTSRIARGWNRKPASASVAAVAGSVVVVVDCVVEVGVGSVVVVVGDNVVLMATDVCMMLSTVETTDTK